MLISNLFNTYHPFNRFLLMLTNVERSPRRTVNYILKINEKNKSSEQTMIS